MWDILHKHKKNYEWAGVVMDLLAYLHSKDVVIEVFHEGELKVRHTKCDVGWYDYEPLIEGMKDNE